MCCRIVPLTERPMGLVQQPIRNERRPVERRASSVESDPAAMTAHKLQGERGFVRLIHAGREIERPSCRGFKVSWCSVGLSLDVPQTPTSRVILATIVSHATSGSAAHRDIRFSLVALSVALPPFEKMS
jgi:hypothetical protein